MLKKSLPLLMLLLAACSSGRRNKDPQPTATPSVDNFIAGRSERLSCDNGSDLTIEYANNGELRLALNTDDKAKAIFKPVAGQYQANPGFYGKPSIWEPQSRRLNFSDPFGNVIGSQCGPAAAN